jgi:uncharacterized protein (TIGR02145 family)
MKIHIEEIQIGKQIWSSSNLGVFTFRNGDAIAEVKGEDEWHNLCNEKMPAYAYLDYKKSKKGGIIYNGYAITDLRNLAPEGWRLPAKKDWEALAKFLKEDEATKIKSVNGWQSGGNGDGSTAFDALPNFSMNPDGVFREKEDQGMYTEFFTTNESKNILGGLCLDHVILEDWKSFIGYEAKSAAYGAAVRLIKE